MSAERTNMLHNARIVRECKAIARLGSVARVLKNLILSSVMQCIIIYLQIYAAFVLDQDWETYSYQIVKR